MMKTILATLFVLATMATASAAQDLSKYTFEGMGGPGFPIGSAKDRLNTGYNFLLGGGLRFNP